MIIYIIIILFLYYYIKYYLFIYYIKSLKTFNIINNNYLFSSLILSSFFCNFTFFIPIYIDFFLIFSVFFFKGPINSIEVFIGFNPCYSILFINFFSLFFQIQFIILILLINKNNVSKLSNPNTNENIQNKLLHNL